MSSDRNHPQRSATRAPVGRVVRLQFDDVIEVEEGLCGNVSIGGMYVDVPKGRPPGTLVRFELVMTAEQSVRGLGEVIWMKPAAHEGTGDGMGIKFRFLEQRDRQMIFKLVSQHIKERLAGPTEDLPEIDTEPVDEVAAAVPGADAEPPVIDFPTADGPTWAAPPEDPPAAEEPADDTVAEGVLVNLDEDQTPAVDSGSEEAAELLPSIDEISALEDFEPPPSLPEITVPAVPQVEGQDLPSGGWSTVSPDSSPDSELESGPVVADAGRPADAVQGDSSLPVSAGELALEAGYGLDDTASRVDPPDPYRRRSSKIRRRREIPVPLLMIVLLALVAGVGYFFRDRLFRGLEPAPVVEAPASSETSGEPTDDADPSRSNEVDGGRVDSTDPEGRAETPDERDSAPSNPAGVTPAPGASSAPADSTPAPPPSRPANATVGDTSPASNDAPPTGRGGDVSGPRDGARATPPASPPASPAPSRPAFGRIADIGWSLQGEGVRVAIALDGVVQDGRFRHFRLEGDSPREVIVLVGVREPYGRTRIPVGNALVNGIRTGFHRKQSGSEIHVVIDLGDPAARVVGIRNLGQRLEVDIQR